MSFKFYSLCPKYYQMRKVFVCLVFFLLSHSSYCQWFLGYSEEEVMEASQKTGGFKQRKLTDNNGTLHVLWDVLDPHATFDAIIQDGFVTSLFIIPQNQASRDQWYFVVDRDYYKVSPGTWKGYQKNKEFYIQYFKMPDGMMAFRIGKSPL